MTHAGRQIEIHIANDLEIEWGAHLLASSEPWITLHVSLQTCLDNCRDTAHLVFIAHISNLPAGIIIIHPKGIAGSPYIKSIAVDPLYRKMGAGVALMQFAEEYAASLSRHLFLCVSSFNEAAIQFYQHLGYAQVGEFEDYIIEGASELLLYKRLS
jgi:ribosomal protein S18 acetylase RimI-like enzyme